MKIIFVDYYTTVINISKNENTFKRAFQRLFTKKTNDFFYKQDRVLLQPDISSHMDPYFFEILDDRGELILRGPCNFYDQDQPTQYDKVTEWAADNEIDLADCDLADVNLFKLIFTDPSDYIPVYINNQGKVEAFKWNDVNVLYDKTLSKNMAWHRTCKYFQYAEFHIK